MQRMQASLSVSQGGVVDIEGGSAGRDEVK